MEQLKEAGAGREYAIGSYPTSLLAEVSCLWGSDEGNDMKYQRIYFYSSSVQHKVLLPAGLGLRPQDAGWWFQPVVPNPCNYGSKWGSWLCTWVLTVLVPFGHEQTGFGVLYQVEEEMRQGRWSNSVAVPGKGTQAQQRGSSSGRGQGIHLVHAQRVRTKLGHDSQHHWQAVKHHRGKGDVVEMSQEKIIWFPVLRSACQVNRQ